MFKNVALISSLFILAVSNFAHADTYLRVRDPRSWHSMQGTIETAVVSVKPNGVYMEIGLYLTFSARGWYYSSTDSLEVEFYFDLPENSVVHDSWLWIEDEIIRGEIMDKWTAASIYEDIVKRRRDPSILYKRGNNNYELRIFPMLASETRKVKLTYLIPTQWNSKNILASLPTRLLRSSKYPVTNFSILTWLDNEWKNPKLFEFPEVKFQALTDSTYGDYLHANVPAEAIQSSLNFSLDSPLNEGIYLNSFHDGNEGIYQLAFLPSKAISLTTTSKIALLFDYDASNCNISAAEILNNVKSNLHASLAEKDSFNLIFSQLNIFRASESWLSADSATIEETFANIGESPVSSYSNLPSLLANGIEFVKENANDANIVLISSSDQVGDYQVANQLIDDLLALMDAEIPVHVADFQDRNFSSNYIGGRYYYGNQYFYTNISRLTSANYYSIHSGYSFPELITTTLSSISGFISSFDLHTRLESGYCHSRYNLNSQEHSVYLDRPIVQIGKFQGSFPFIIEASGIYKSEIFSQQIVVDAQNIIQTDSLSEEAWTGNYIQYLESQEQSNDIIDEILDYSLDERVLSIYTAFICLEPQRGGQICYDCMDESELVGIEDMFATSDKDTIFKAYPNPFNNQVKLDFSLPMSLISEEISFKIYNILGQTVRTFQSNGTNQGNSYQFIWDGKTDAGSDVSSGTYFFVVNTAEKRYALKLMYMK